MGTQVRSFGSALAVIAILAHAVGVVRLVNMGTFGYYFPMLLSNYRLFLFQLLPLLIVINQVNQINGVTLTSLVVHTHKLLVDLLNRHEIGRVTFYCLLAV